MSVGVSAFRIPGSGEFNQPVSWDTLGGVEYKLGEVPRAGLQLAFLSQPAPGSLWGSPHTWPSVSLRLGPAL